MENNTTIGFIGAGNMSYALISGLINNGYSNKKIKASDANTELLSQRSSEFNLEVFTDNSELAINCDVVVLAVKPQVLSTVCRDIKNFIKHKPLVLSIAAGVKSIDINRWLGGKASIVRAMPNTPALLGKGVTGIYANDKVSEKQKSIGEEILNSVGSCLWVENEVLLDAVTSLSGSGAALGLDKKIAQELSIQTALGAGMMASNSENVSIRQLRANVTSPNGTTEAAINSFQDQNFELIVSRAMRAAFERARTIGAELGDDD